MVAKKLPKTYKIKKGESYRIIAKKFALEPKEFIALNDLKFPFTLKTGQIVKVASIKKTNKTKIIKKVVKNTVKKTEKKNIAVTKESKTAKKAPSKIKKTSSIKTKKTSAKTEIVIKRKTSKGSKSNLNKSKKFSPKKKVSKKKSYAKKVSSDLLDENIYGSIVDEKDSNWFLKSVVFIFSIIVVLTLVRIFILNGSERRQAKYDNTSKENVERVMDVLANRDKSFSDEELKALEEVPAQDSDVGETIITAQKDIEIVLLNGSGRQGHTKAFSQKFQDKKVKFVNFDNAENFNHLNTVIEYPIEKLDQVLVLKEYFDELGLKYQLKESFDIQRITVIIGSDN